MSYAVDQYEYDRYVEREVRDLIHTNTCDYKGTPRNQISSLRRYFAERLDRTTQLLETLTQQEIVQIEQVHQVLQGRDYRRRYAISIVQGKQMLGPNWLASYDKWLKLKEVFNKVQQEG
jgi:hypothetical protein